MSAAETAVLAALRARLTSDPGVKAVLGDPARFYDERPADPVYPYATLGRVESRPAGAAGAATLETTATLHVWSRYAGRSEALEAIAALRGAADDADLAVAGRRLILLFATYTDVFRGPDGFTTHGVLRLRALSEPV